MATTSAVTEADQLKPWPTASRAWTCATLLAVAHMINQFDAGLTGYLIETIKADFQASDLQMSLLIGLAPSLFYAIVGLPLARLIDRYPRRIVLPIGSLFMGLFTLFCGLAQTFWQLFLARMFVGSSATVNGPGFYSLLADYFPPHKLTRAIAVMQLGFVFGAAAASVLGGALVATALTWDDTQFIGLTLKAWHKVYMIGAIGSCIVAFILWMVREPERRDVAVSISQPKSEMITYREMFAEFWARRGVYFPLFGALAITSIEGFGILVWRIPFLQRTYGWSVDQIGYWQGATTLVFSLIGLPLGTMLTEYLQKRYDDAPVRSILITWCGMLPFAVMSPLMPTAELSILTAGVSLMFGMASAVSQNSALQIITPNRMRAQVTALYLFMYTVMGMGLGPTMFTGISILFGGENYLGPAMAATVAAMLPIAIIILMLGLKPYARAIRDSRNAGLM